MNRLPAIVDFVEALSLGSDAFRSLENFSVRLDHRGVPAVNRTSLFAEAEITLGGRRWLLCAPLRSESLEIVGRAMRAGRRADRLTVPEWRILCEEFRFDDSCGGHCCCDLLLQRYPEGETLEEAVTHIDTQRLLCELEELRSRFVKHGLRHRNLKPSNLVFGLDGRLHAVRCYYLSAGSEVSAIEGEFDKVRGFILSHPEIDGECEPPVSETLRREFDDVEPLHDMMQIVVREGLYGYADDEERVVIEPCFTYAEPFFENRAIVERCRGCMGVIDKQGRYVVPPEYDMISWTDKGRFRVRKGELVGELDYSGAEMLPLQRGLAMDE